MNTPLFDESDSAVEIADMASVASTVGRNFCTVSFEPLANLHH